MGQKTELAISILNGAVGDYLARAGNALATQMTCVHAGRLVPMTREGLATAYPEPTARVAVLVHGLMCTEDHWSFDDGENYGSLLARDLGYTPLILRYNSGQAIPDSGGELARLLDSLHSVYPVPIEEILPIGFSMGGLVIRSACHIAATEDKAWLRKIRRAIYVGTPHHGAPLERFARSAARLLGRIDDPYTRLIATLTGLRSAGLQDLGDADLRHEDRARRCPTISLRDKEHPVPLLPSMQHFLIAGSVSANPRLSTLFGDVMVPVPSATNGVCSDPKTMALPPSHVKILSGMAHMKLMRHPAAYEQILKWCQEDA
jgi:pimeloyl-ACP methyl ester carboxylesterase